MATLVAFFKVLADGNRLKIVGLLSQQPDTVEQLATLLGVSSPTVSHYLRKLARAGRGEGLYSVYTLRPEVLHEQVKTLPGEGDLGVLAEDVDPSAFDRKALGTLTDGTAMITAFPAQRKKYAVLLRHVFGAFEPGVRHPEEQVNDTLARSNADTARLRRSLVEHGLMPREGGGGDYWRVDVSKLRRRSLDDGLGAHEAGLRPPA